MEILPKNPLSNELPNGSETVCGPTLLVPYQHVTADLATFDRTLVSGVAWTAAIKWGSQLLTWGTTVVVARVLTPADYGLVGMATVYLGFVALFSEFGLGTVIVTLREMTDDQLAQLNTLSLLAGVLAFLISAALAVPLGRFFHAGALPWVLLVMSPAFVFSSFRTVPYSLLGKEMRFKLLAFLEGLQSMLTAILTLSLALYGLGYWALALGNLSVSVFATVLTLIYKRHRFLWPKLSSLREPIRFGRHLLVSRLSWYAYDNSDFAIAGRRLGQMPLGAYTMAWTIAHVPLEKLTTMVNRVTPSVFGVVRGDTVALCRYLELITGGLAVIIYPVTLGVTLVASDLVHTLFGTKWEAAVLPLQLLALHALIRSNVILLSPVLSAIGEARFEMWINVASLIVLPASFWLGAHWGIGGIASAWVVVYPILSIPLFWRAFKKIQMPVGDYFKAIWPAVSGCVVMVVVVEAVRGFLHSSGAPYINLFADVFWGAAAYVVILMMQRPYLASMLRLMQEFRSTRRKDLEVG